MLEIEGDFNSMFVADVSVPLRDITAISVA
jgi:hypothetical protein